MTTGVDSEGRDRVEIIFRLTKDVVYVLTSAAFKAGDVSQSGRGYAVVPTGTLSWLNGEAPAKAEYRETWTRICTDLACTTELTKVPVAETEGYYIRYTITSDVLDGHVMRLDTLKAANCSLELEGWYAQCLSVTTGVDPAGRRRAGGTGNPVAADAPICGDPYGKTL